jgi:hypothetical protein
MLSTGMQFHNVAIFSQCLNWLVTLPIQPTEEAWREHLIVLACTAVGAAVVFASIGFGFALEALVRTRIRTSRDEETRM